MPSAEVLKITEILRKTCNSLIREFHEIQTLQNSRNVSDFFLKLYKKAELFLIRELKRYKLDAELSHEFIVFPINGKRNFLRGIPHFTISVLVKKDNEPFICVIEAPMLHTTFWAQSGFGAFLEDLSGSTRIKIGNCQDLKSALALLSADCSFSWLVNYRIFGAAILDAAYVASGRADVLVINAEKENKNIILLSKLIVEESGGNTTKIGHYFVFSNSILVKEIKNAIHDQKQL